MHGPNKLAEPPARPEWKKFLDQFRSGIVAILAVVAVSWSGGRPQGHGGDRRRLLVNAVLGFVQEHRAERSLAALRQMLVATARVRWNGLATDVAAARRAGAG